MVWHVIAIRPLTYVISPTSLRDPLDSSSWFAARAATRQVTKETTSRAVGAARAYALLE